MPKPGMMAVPVPSPAEAVPKSLAWQLGDYLGLRGPWLRPPTGRWSVRRCAMQT